MIALRIILDKYSRWVLSGKSQITLPLFRYQRDLAQPINDLSLNDFSDKDGNIIDICMLNLATYHPNEYRLIMANYLYHLPKRKLARMTGVDEKNIRTSIKYAEYFIDGYLSQMNYHCYDDLRLTGQYRAREE